MAEDKIVITGRIKKYVLEANLKKYTQSETMGMFTI